RDFADRSAESRGRQIERQYLLRRSREVRLHRDLREVQREALDRNVPGRAEAEARDEDVRKVELEVVERHPGRGQVREVEHRVRGAAPDERLLQQRSTELVAQLRDLDVTQRRPSRFSAGTTRSAPDRTGDAERERTQGRVRRVIRTRGSGDAVELE